MAERECDPADWYRVVAPQDEVRQGDQLFGITLRVVIPSEDALGTWDVGEFTADVIVATRSCDLEQAKVAHVEVIPCYALAEWLRVQPAYYTQVESIRRGHVPGAYLLPGWREAPVEAARTTRVVAFDEKRSIPWRELEAARRAPRLGLRSPYIEHFGQAVARFYMRVGLPEDIPPVEWKPVEEAGRKAEHVSLSPADFAAAGLPEPAAPLTASIQRVQLAGGPDLLYRVILDRDGNYFGVGADADEAVDSLRRYLVARRAELARRPAPEGRKPHWLLTAFPGPA